MPRLKQNRVSFPGTNVQGNRIYEEYLGSLKTSAINYPIYDKMRRSDSQIQRTLRAITAPILSGSFRYIASDTKDAELIRQAEYKNKFFNEYPIYSWQQMLKEILTELFAGFSIFEPTYHVVDDPNLGKVITLKNLGYLKQSTIDQWEIKDNQPTRVHQTAVTPQGNSIDIWLDFKDLLLFTFDREGDNFEGISILRSVYGNYVRKDLFNKIDMIGLEKMAIGTPVWYAPNSVLDNTKELTKLQSIAENYVGHEQAYLLLSTAFKDGGFEIIPGQYNADAVDQAIKREDAAIVDSVLASFLNIGTARAGGNAQNEGQMNLFLESLMYVAKDITDVLDNLVHSMYVLNFGPTKTKLKMQITGITQDDAEKAMTVLRGYVTSGIVKADDRLEAYTREKLSLPVIDKSSIREFKSTPDYKQDQPKQDQEMPKEQSQPEMMNE